MFFVSFFVELRGGGRRQSHEGRAMRGEPKKDDPMNRKKNLSLSLSLSLSLVLLETLQGYETFSLPSVYVDGRR